MPPIPSPSLYELIHTGKIRVTQKSPVEHRFWSRVNKLGPIHPVWGRCWLWTAGGLRAGYGKIIGQLTHRYSYQLHFKTIPKCVLHKCDNPTCVNPDHLMAGTQQDNLQDMRDKGHQVRGEEQGKSKLTEKQVREIRETWSMYGTKVLARKFGICTGQVWKIVNNYCWRHV